ncbi:hypothetical protein G6F50_017772 [Rhizopus delemar]|uniref:Uncharacterized protein n=1 Tax=Rhizopus delemar TaxID=936053 RepID=A0A9P7C052_9FUNG|nr:hypothetical protein G6F50_017772 [Rhizopus delemar]
MPAPRRCGEVPSTGAATPCPGHCRRHWRGRPRSLHGACGRCGPESPLSACSARSPGWWLPRRTPPGVAGKRSGYCSTPLPPGAMPVSCASRSAVRCARSHACSHC